MNTIKKLCDEIIIEIASGDGDVFLDDRVDAIDGMDMEELISLTQYLKYVRDLIEFASLFKQIVLVAVSIVVRFIPVREVVKLQREIDNRFNTRHKDFIEQLWYWIASWNLWFMIKFFASIILTIGLNRSEI